MGDRLQSVFHTRLVSLASACLGALAVLAVALAVPVAQATPPRSGGYYAGQGPGKNAWWFKLSVDASARKGHVRLGLPTRCRMDGGLTFNGGLLFELNLRISPAGAVSGSWNQVKRTQKGIYKGQVIRDFVQVRGSFAGSKVNLRVKGGHVQTFRRLFQNCESRGWVRMHGKLSAGHT